MIQNPLVCDVDDRHTSNASRRVKCWITIDNGHKHWLELLNSETASKVTALGLCQILVPVG